MKKLFAILLFCSTGAFAAQNVLTFDFNNADIVSGSVTTFAIERKAEACTGPGAFVQVATMPAQSAPSAQRTYVDATVAQNTAYCYRVAAVNATGKGPYSNTAGRLVPLELPLVAPTNLQVGG